MIRILVVDDHASYRQGLRALLQRQGDLCVVGEAADGQQALDFCAACTADALPQLVLLDLRMQGMDGIEAARQLRRRHPALALLASSSHDDPALVRAFIAAGGNGYLLKGEALPEMLHAIRSVAAGAPWFSAALRFEAAAEKRA